MVRTMGVDLGRRHDSTAIVVVERGDDDDVVRVLVARELKGIPFPTQIAEVKHLVATYDPISISVDETGMGIPTVEWMRQEIGSRIEGLTFTPQSKAELVARTVVLLQDHKLKFGTHPRLRSQLHSIRREVTKDGRILYRVDDAIGSGGGHADLAWALLLAVHAIRDMSYVPLPRNMQDLLDAYANMPRPSPMHGILSGDPGTGPRGPPPKSFEPRCPSCGASLRTSSHVKAHRASACPEAGRELGDAAKVPQGPTIGQDADGRLYTIETPEKCPFCPRLYPRSLSAALENHIRDEHPAEYEAWLASRERE